GIYFISSKAGLLTIILVLFFIGIRSLVKKFNYLKLAISLLVLTVISIVLIGNNRISLTLKQFATDFAVEKDSGESSQSRIQAWHASLSLAKENLVFGVSPGDASDKLKAKYKELEYSKAEFHNLNSHNQYFEDLVSLGLIGLSILIAILFGPIFIKDFRKNYLFIIFILIFAFNFIFESMLETRSGIVFFMFFYTLLIYISNNLNNDTIFATKNK
ncbi:MAG: O-antigen ligase family protein, partial [Bacteroidales bacterium]|nr:O-antigen ligase family protein [Bacteroidales bacterium]